MMTEPSAKDERAIQVVQCVAGTQALRILTNELNAVLGQDGVRTTPVVLLSIAGPYRTGKSFLLNILLRYLHAKESNTEDTWLKNKEEKFTGFRWESGCQRTTIGMHLWSKPFHAKINGETVAIILMDTQGMGDECTDPKQMGIMLALSTLVSSMQIFNISRNIKEEDLFYLESLVESGKLVLETAEDSKCEKPFQKFVYLVRDWSDPSKYPYGSHGGDLYLQDKLKIGENQPERLRHIRSNLNGIFDELRCFLMPHPGLRAALFERDDSDEESEPFGGKLAELDSKFLKCLPDLIHLLLSPNELTVKKCSGTVVTGEVLMGMFERYTRPFQNGSLPEPGQTREVVLGQYNNVIATNLIEEFQLVLDEYKKNKKQCPSKEEVCTFLSAASSETLGKFSGRIRGNIPENVRIHQRVLAEVRERERKCKDHFSGFRLAEQEANETICKEAGAQARSTYTSIMAQVKKGSNDEGKESIISKHIDTKRMILDTFMAKTNHCQGIQSEFLEGLQDFLDDEFERLRIITEESVKETEEEMKYCLYMSAEAREEYRDRMQEKLDLSEPADEDTLNHNHAIYKDVAETTFLKKTENVKGPNKELRQRLDKELLKYCDKQRGYFEKANQRNAVRFQETEMLRRSVAWTEAKDTYRAHMEQDCALGNKYLRQEDLEMLHSDAIAEAGQTLMKKVGRVHCTTCVLRCIS